METPSGKVQLYLTTILCSRDFPGKTQLRAYSALALASNHDEAIGKAHTLAMQRFPTDDGWAAPTLVASELDAPQVRHMLDQVDPQVNAGQEER